MAASGQCALAFLRTSAIFFLNKMFINWPDEGTIIKRATFDFKGLNALHF